MPLHVVKPAPAPTSARERVADRLNAAKPAEMLQCSRCGGREVIETKVGVLMRGGKASGGTKQILCATCWRRGERVVLA